MSELPLEWIVGAISTVSGLLGGAGLREWWLRRSQTIVGTLSDLVADRGDSYNDGIIDGMRIAQRTYDARLQELVTERESLRAQLADRPSLMEAPDGALYFSTADGGAQRVEPVRPVTPQPRPSTSR